MNGPEELLRTSGPASHGVPALKTLGSLQAVPADLTDQVAVTALEDPQGRQHLIQTHLQKSHAGNGR